MEQMSFDSEVEDILHTPTLQKLRTLERLSTDALDPATLQAAAAAAAETSNSGAQQVRQSRPRDRQHRRSFSPLLDSTERDHYSVSVSLSAFHIFDYPHYCYRPMHSTLLGAC